MAANPGNRFPSSEKGTEVGPIFLGLLLIACSIGVVAWNLKWVKGSLNGPALISPDTLAALNDPGDLANPWVTFTADNVFDTGMGKISQSTKNVRSIYVVAEVKGRWLVAEAPPAMSGKKLTGYLGTWTHQNGRNVVGTLSAQYPKADILPFQLDANRNATVQCFCLLGTMGFFCLGGLFAISRGFAGGGVARHQNEIGYGDVFTPSPGPGGDRRA